MTTGPATSAGGMVVVGELTFSVGKLSVSGERQLRRGLEGVARTQRDASHTAALHKFWSELRAAGLTDEWAVSVRHATDAVTGPVSGAELFDARTSPNGVALELFLRTRKAHPQVTLEAIKAIITDDNADAVFEAMLAAVTDDQKSP